MAVKPCSLRIDARRHEIDNRGTPMFPCGGYITTVGDHITELIPWHWHEEVEVLIVTRGTLRIEVPNHTILVKEGEGAFINSRVLQTAVNAGEDICEIKSLVFDPLLVSGSLQNAIEQKYIRPLLNNPQLSLIHFQKEHAWHKDAIGFIEKAFADYQEESFGYELLVRDNLSRLWFGVVSNSRNELANHQDSRSTESTRIKEMLTYIHAHYMEPINLKGISDSVAISERECLRCFKKVLGTTPMKYLLNYRVSAAAGLLTNSDLNVTEISRLCGFESPSYFSLRFKALTEMTPSEYKHQSMNLHGD